MSTLRAAKIVDQPRADGQPIAVAGPVVFVVQPAHTENGFLKIERPNKQFAWILEDALSAGPANCVPTLMSSGLILMGAR